MATKRRYGGGFDGRGGIGGKSGSFGQNDGSGTGEDLGDVTPREEPDDEHDPALKSRPNVPTPGSAHRTTREGEP
jgi:hypothetical protein